MITSKEIKNKIQSYGADICGIAPVKRFENAPRGFHPCDILSECKSVAVFAKRFPKYSISAKSCVSYTHLHHVIFSELDAIALKTSIFLEDKDIINVIIPADDPYEYWNDDEKHGKGILSLRHAGYLAGLGVLGKNTLLINNNFGNMILLCAILIGVALDGDPLAEYSGCLENCRKCIDNCPVNALNGLTVIQKQCRKHGMVITGNGTYLKKCSLCRENCPSFSGIVNEK